MASLDNDTKIRMIGHAQGPVAVDTEIVPLGGISVAFRGMPNGFYFGVNHAGEHNLTSVQLDALFNALYSREALVFHNAPHDLAVLEDYGRPYTSKFYDTMLMAHWVNEERFNYSLDAISRAYGGRPKEKPKLMQDLIDQDGWDSIPFKMMEEYSSHDAWITMQAFDKIEAEFFLEFTEELWQWEQDFIREVIIPMKRRGIKLDLEFSIREYMRGVAIMEECRKELGFDPGKPAPLTKFLIDDLGLPVLNRTKTGRVQMTKKELAQYEQMLEHKNDGRASTVLRYRGWQKTTSSNYKAYLNLADEHSVLHPNYKLHGTKTSRLSCELPNLQQIPKTTNKEWNGKLKDAFIPRQGFRLWTIDFSQLQFRMAVSYANEERLIEIFNDRSRDIFSEMAKDLDWVRDDIKTLVYLTLFGGGSGRAKDAFGVSLEDAKILVGEFNSEYPGIKRVATQAQHAAQRLGYIQMWTGRRRHFKKTRENPKPAYYRAFNAAIQGGEAEIIKRCMIELARTVCDDNCFLLLQIHDEIVFEIREGMEEDYLARAQKVMEEVPKAFCDFTGVPVAFHSSAGKWGAK
jgi:DNA polymerase-1